MIDMTALERELERLIDHYGLDSVLFSIADVCVTKAEHLRSNWQDEHLAHDWERKGGAVVRVAIDVE